MIRRELVKIFLFQFFPYLIEDDDEEEDIESGTRQTNVGKVVKKFEHFYHILLPIGIHLHDEKLKLTTTKIKFVQKKILNRKCGNTLDTTSERPNVALPCNT